MRRLAVALTLLLAACGGGGGGEASSLAGWNAKHGAVIKELGLSLDAVQAATKAGEPVGIRTSCAALKESLVEARATLPVPDAKADADVRAAIDAMAAGVSDCVDAMAKGDARQLERSITQLRDARLKLDTANAALGSLTR